MALATSPRQPTSAPGPRPGGPALSPADVCLIVEGCYPYIPGGVSAWIDWLIRTQPDLAFSVVVLWPRPTTQPPRYPLPPNVTALHQLYLQDFGQPPRGWRRARQEADAIADALSAFMDRGGVVTLAHLNRALDLARNRRSLERMFNSPLAWQVVERMYATGMPYGSFLHFFWAWRALFGGLFATLEYPLPPARVYHAISTGYAGVFAARAAMETARPTLLTEHGIYTNERRIELLMADWVADTIEKGHHLADPRFDLRDMWVKAFEAYARTCYEAATEIVTLFGDNQRAQRLLGADDRRLRVIANGIDVERFKDVRRPPAGARPTMALIGRVVPIKDVKTYIVAAKLLRQRVPDLSALIMGPTDEDPEYYGQCRALVAELGLTDTVEFTGQVNIVEHMSRVHVVVLTSLSESQPLVVLEAGAAGIPFVATNVGSCREILEGRPDETPHLGPGGIVTDLVAPAQIADAVHALLSDPRRAEACGEALRARVKTYYRSDQAVAAYSALYRRLMALGDARPQVPGG
jgi:glycosyltransferase involved in cell wall biosynthesis